MWQLFELKDCKFIFFRVKFCWTRKFIEVGLFYTDLINSENGTFFETNWIDVFAFIAVVFLDSTRSIERNSYGNVAGWMGGWLSQPVLYQND